MEVDYVPDIFPGISFFVLICFVFLFKGQLFNIWLSIWYLPLVLLFFQSNVKGEMMLLATDFSSQLTDQIETYLSRFNSIPAFLSNITLDLFNRQTQTIVINWRLVWTVQSLMCVSCATSQQSRQFCAVWPIVEMDTELRAMFIKKLEVFEERFCKRRPWVRL